MRSGLLLLVLQNSKSCPRLGAVCTVSDSGTLLWASWGAVGGQLWVGSWLLFLNIFGVIIIVY